MTSTEPDLDLPFVPRGRFVWSVSRSDAVTSSSFFPTGAALVPLPRQQPPEDPQGGTRVIITMDSRIRQTKEKKLKLKKLLKVFPKIIKLNPKSPLRHAPTSVRLSATRLNSAVKSGQLQTGLGLLTRFTKNPRVFYGETSLQISCTVFAGV